MLWMKQPALAINSIDSALYRYKLSYTVVAPPGLTAAGVVSCIRHWATVAVAQGNALRNVVINCHGHAGSLSLGGKGWPPITINDVPQFADLRYLLASIPTIWITACKPASGSAGEAFCAALAKAMKCRVVASSDTQWRSSSDAFKSGMARQAVEFTKSGTFAGAIDEYEGVVWMFDQNGTRLACLPHGLTDFVN